MRDGELLARDDRVAAARHRFEHDLAWLPDTARTLTDPSPVPVHPTAALTTLADSLRRSLTP